MLRGRFTVAVRLGLVALSGAMSITSYGAMAQITPGLAQHADPDTLAREMHMRTLIANAWHDATKTWNEILGTRLYESDLPQINFVAAVRPSHCYGLYVGTGPVYCSGNNTVFVSLAEMDRLSTRLGSAADEGYAFLVAHELGHHVQKIIGRFRVLSALMRESPHLQRELVIRFELEADCLAGVWAGNSPGYAKDEGVRAGILGALDAIGDDKARVSGSGQLIDPAQFTHGTSEQRTRWYLTGYQNREIDACNVLEAAEY